ncbi:MAG: flagellin [Gudongella sp.]|nr:flagellin [Gudongella sp.]
MRINQNISAMNTYSRLTAANNAKSSSLAKLSSGLRINKAGDDAAGLSISEKMRGQIGGLNQANRNAQDGISLIQTAEGALSETHSILQRMRELSVQAANGTNSSDDLLAIKAEGDELVKEITNISTNTRFNGIQLLGESADSTPVALANVTLQIGANEGEELELDLVNKTAADANTLFTAATIDVSLGTVSTTQIDAAIKTVSAARSYLGANQNRLEHTINNLTATSENLTAAESRIRDVDMAEEMMTFTKNNILSQAATSMLAQANQMPQSVLQLLQ